tara:strand:- start:32 stop:361 length:330 start_codon:yes stop_codon:yes gene_type:complete
MSCEDYVPERDNDFDEFESSETFKEHVDKLTQTEIEQFQDKALKKIYNEGGLSVENIIEIQYMMELIKYVPENYKDKQESIAKCLELIINLANQYLELYSKSDIKKSKK